MEGAIAKPLLSQEEKDAITIQRLRDDLRRLKARERVIMRSGATAEVAVEELREFLSAEKNKIIPVQFEPVPSVKITAKQMFSAKHTETAALNLGDWHIAEVVSPLALNGMNEHNTLIAAGKLWRIVEKFVRIVRQHEMMYQISDIWVPVLGDMISGSIHKELVLSNDLLDIPATVLAARLLIMIGSRLKCLGKPIVFDCVVGNHPRLLESMPTKIQAQTNLDWMCYEMLRTYFEASNDEQITVNVHLSQQALVNLRGHNVVLDHGYGQSASKMDELDTKFRNMFDGHDVREHTGNTGTAVDFVIAGDKHRSRCEDWLMVNGSLVGCSELTTAWRLKPVRAVQQCFGVSDEYIPTFYYPLSAHFSQCRTVDNPLSRYVKDFQAIYGR